MSGSIALIAPEEPGFSQARHNIPRCPVNEMPVRIPSGCTEQAGFGLARMFETTSRSLIVVVALKRRANRALLHGIPETILLGPRHMARFHRTTPSGPPAAGVLARFRTVFRGISSYLLTAGSACGGTPGVRTVVCSIRSSGWFATFREIRARLSGWPPTAGSTNTPFSVQEPLGRGASCWCRGIVPTQCFCRRLAFWVVYDPQFSIISYVLVEVLAPSGQRQTSGLPGFAWPAAGLVIALANILATAFSPFVAVSLLAGPAKRFRPSLYEAAIAQIGASAWQRFRFHHTFPCLLHILAIGVFGLMTVLRSIFPTFADFQLVLRPYSRGGTVNSPPVGQHWPFPARPLPAEICSATNVGSAR